MCGRVLAIEGSVLAGEKLSRNQPCEVQPPKQIDEGPS